MGLVDMPNLIIVSSIHPIFYCFPYAGIYAHKMTSMQDVDFLIVILIQFTYMVMHELFLSYMCINGAKRSPCNFHHVNTIQCSVWMSVWLSYGNVSETLQFTRRKRPTIFKYQVFSCFCIQIQITFELCL